MNIELVTAPTALPVTVQEISEYLRLDTRDEEYTVATLLNAAVAWIDGPFGVLGRAVMPQTWRQVFECYGKNYLALPDVLSATGEYLDENDVWQAATVALDRDGDGWFVEIESPATAAKSYRVDYVCALPAAQLPTVVMALKMLVAAWFENRIGSGEVPPAVTWLISPLRRWG